MSQPPPPYSQPGEPAWYQTIPPQPSQPPFNMYAILALILAVAVFPPLGIYFGNVAKRQIAETGERGIELAQAAVIAGWILTALLGLMLLFFCAIFAVTLGFFGAFLSIFGIAVSQTP